MAIRDKLLALGICACLTMPALIACEEKGPAEKAGEQIDEAVEKAADAVEEGAEKAKEKME